MSISGIISFCSFLTPGLDETLASPSISISDDVCRLNEACGLPIVLSRPLAVELDAGYVSVMTWAIISGLRRLRIEEIDLRARRENLASKRVTALSSRAKLLFISIVVRLY
jgi:hypothetical protein